MTSFNHSSGMKIMGIVETQILNEDMISAVVIAI